ncbi:SpoVR family protein [Planctomyces sp. SH-PL62]|uniref:SpoVR family protein n=1 Tax=Planctomyces sp. SH-PL62 TaxID=1636152 RepID=UPI00078DD6FE|nr:SpoVR family protein [Planctomyces sp. SH-PL62]AMV39143.1 SpoVR family protein [Planctomyces sp. SH-PL62]
MSIASSHDLPADLRAIQLETEGHARDYGLDFYETIFEVLDYDEISEIAAFGGFPTRYPHWRFGMEYQQLSKGYRYGLQKIYEMVINNDPCYAYLLRCNQLVDQKLVMAHVYGHNDFFKNNIWFGQTNRKMMDETANHGTRIRSYMERFGEDEVESFIDSCLSLENLIDVYSPHIKRRDAVDRYDFQGAGDGPGEAPSKFQSKSYMDGFINPPEVLKEAQRQQDAERRNAKPLSFPEQPERDVLLFLLEHAPLQTWQRDVLAIIREEAYYFAPQGQTKIMNEGWASFWHSTIMTQKILHPSELLDYADHHSGTMATQPGRLNPYKLGIELLRDIEDRWNKGQFGPEWEECDDYEAKRRWNKEVGLGREKIFEVRRVHNDVTFIDTFLTHDFCKRYQLFSFKHNDQNDLYEIESREFKKIKERLLFNLTNFGQPIIRVRDGNFRNRGELYLGQEHFGVDLRLDYAQDTIRHLHRLWTRPVHLETTVDGRPTLLSFDGTDHSIRPLGGVPYDAEPKDRRRA